MLRPIAHPVACCWMLLRVVAQSLKPVKLFSQQLPTFPLFHDRRSVAQQCWIRLHSSSNIVGATHAHYAWITKTYGLYSSHDALQVPNLLGVVASVCTPLPTRTQQLPTLLAQRRWELLRPFARSLKPRGEAKWPYTPIKPDPWIYWTTSKTFLEKRVSMELITMTLLWTLEISIRKKHYVWNYYVTKSNLTRV